MPSDPATETERSAPVPVVVDLPRDATADENMELQVHATSWADGTTHEALLVIAEGITQLAGFDVAAVSVVRDSQHMQVMAGARSGEARDILQGTYTPIARLMGELEHAEDWGMFKFVPH